MLWDEILYQSKKQLIDSKQVFREEQQKTILTCFSQKGYFDTIVFQGGTALRLCYENPRFSEDLDFTLKKY
jgi:predicted nucleotidyltransferase component of viral defense system